MGMEAIIKPYKDYAIIEEPFYLEINNEVTDFTVAFRRKRPLSLIGPTGCGKTTLATYMSYRLRQDMITGGDITKVAKFSQAEKQAGGSIAFPYIEIPCHEDMTETHLVGRWGLNGEWLPGPLYIGSTQGGIVVLDEIVEARKDAIVILHPLTDDRRVLPVPKKGEVIQPPDHLMVVICYNPGYQVKSKDLKPSTRQRFPTIVMDYPPPEKEKVILQKKVPGLPDDIADRLTTLARDIRKAKDANTLSLQEGASTRLLVMAGEFYMEYKAMGLEPDFAHIARITIFNPISNEDTEKEALEMLLKTQ
ncbi:TPA: CbbQ/NirQ/NorQ/GpvN family protein [Candidatus Woesearchaeota archaeon]|nr:CbbQ/NirQ/NorQ/GpvN family protein [Candidatus Woesearchaeota archaeon]